MIRLIAYLMFVLFSAHSFAEAATYWVDDSGSDSNTCTQAQNSSTPKLTMGNLSGSVLFCVGPGDTIIVKNGTYAPSTPTNRTIFITGTVANGASGNPITIKAENYLGAKLIAPGVDNVQNSAIYLNKDWWVVEGFEIDGSTTTYGNGSNSSHNGIVMQASNSIIRRNKIHHIARTACTLGFGNSGIYGPKLRSNNLVEYNVIYTVGRLRVGENGCGQSFENNDHGMYMEGQTNLTVRNNVLWDVNRGYCIQAYTTGGGTHTNLTWNNNTCAAGAPSLPRSHFVLTGTITTASIKNNLGFEPNLAFIDTCCSLVATGVVVDYNRINLNDADSTSPANMFWPSVPSGVTGANNVDNSPLGFKNASCVASDGSCEATDFTLLSTSNAINAGTNVGRPYNGSAPDQGAFETFTVSGGTVSGNVAIVQADMALNTPLIPGTLGYTFKVNGVARNITNVALSGSSAIALTFDGSACVIGQSLTASYDATVGTASDSALIGGSLNQPMFSFTDLPLTNNCAGAAYALTQTAGAIYSAIGDQSTTVPITEVAPGGLLAPRTKWKATVADPPALTTKLQYSITGVNGTYSDVPDSFGAGIIKYVGLTNYPNMDGHGTLVTVERLTSEFSGMVTGAVVRCLSGCEVPAPDLAQDSESEQVDILEISPSATPGTVIWFRRVESDGTVMTYAGGARPSITVKEAAASSVAQADQPTGLSVTPNPTQVGLPLVGWPVDAPLNLWSPCWSAANGPKWGGQPTPFLMYQSETLLVNRME